MVARPVVVRSVVMGHPAGGEGRGAVEGQDHGGDGGGEMHFEVV
jgi:hypothetical protein